MDAYLKGSSLMIIWQNSPHFVLMASKLQIWVAFGHTRPPLVKVSLKKNLLSKKWKLRACIHAVNWMSSSVDDALKPSVDSASWTSVLGPDMTLEIQTLLEKLPEANRVVEIKQVSTAFTKSLYLTQTTLFQTGKRVKTEIVSSCLVSYNKSSESYFICKLSKGYKWGFNWIVLSKNFIVGVLLQIKKLLLESLQGFLNILGHSCLLWHSMLCVCVF